MKARRSKADVVAFVETNCLHAEVLELDGATERVEDAAAMVGANPEQIVKSVVFIVAAQPVLVLGLGTRRIDRAKIARHLGVRARDVRLARRDEVLAITGYEAGAVPPVGHADSLPVLADTALSGLEDVYAGGGSPHALLHIAAADLLVLSRATLVDVMERKKDA